MPSTHKTSLFNLNQWLGTDKPKREDFNNDNLNIENGVKAHIQNTAVHVTADDRQQWNSNTPVSGKYTGDNTPMRTITLGFQPRIVVLFSDDRPLLEYSSQGGTNNLYAAIYTSVGSSVGIQGTATGFTVANSISSVSGGLTLRLNQTTKSYTYLAYR